MEYIEIDLEACSCNTTESPNLLENGDISNLPNKRPGCICSDCKCHLRKFIYSETQQQIQTKIQQYMMYFAATSMICILVYVTAMYCI